MKISIFIVTYKNDNLLNKCIKSIFDANKTNDIIKTNILNNYSTIQIDPLFQDKVQVIQNDGIPSFSTGHLARSWNQCIMHSIKDINNPDCDTIILAQNDTVFRPDFISNIKNYLRRYSYITMGKGDEVQIITPYAIKNIGMFDERFCNIGFQEADYFLRAIILNSNGTSINDAFHSRIHNPLENNIIEDVPNGYNRKDEINIESCKYHRISRQLFSYKWKGIILNNEDPENWSEYTKSLKVCPKQYMFYPYFETNLPNLNNKYIVY
jgi:hypothetical protein